MIKKKTSKPAVSSKSASAKSSKPAAAKSRDRGTVLAAKPAKTVAPAVKRAAPKAITTTIAAQVDVGFGNTLYIRGEGPGLDWEKGLPMACILDDKWAVSLTNASKPITCKFLINDLIWCAGDDFTVTPGTSVSFVPIF